MADLTSRVSSTRKASITDRADSFLDRVIGIDSERIPRLSLPLLPDTRAYTPAPVRFGIQLVQELTIRADDVVYEWGSGIGCFAHFIKLFSAADVVKAIERDPAYHLYGEELACRNQLSGIEFINKDVRAVDCSDGTIFILYTPFEGSVLHEALAPLEALAQKQPVTLCSLWRCSGEIIDHAQKWLRITNRYKNLENDLVIFQNEIARRMNPVVPIER